jgi:hypothetical protein
MVKAQKTMLKEGWPSEVEFEYHATRRSNPRAGAFVSIPR